jgi:hypothetical protein
MGCQMPLCNKDIAHSMTSYIAKENISLAHIINVLSVIGSRFKVHNMHIANREPSVFALD